jgi:hypothetical protein
VNGMDNRTIDGIVKKAYEHYLKVRDPEIDKLALKTLSEFHDFIEKWNGSPESLRGISFFRNFLTGTPMDSIAARGMALANIENFNKVMNKVSTVKKIAKLVCIRRDNPFSEGLVNKIAEVNFIPHVINHPAVEGVRPILYTHRFLLSMFIEMMTTIADRVHLDQTARLLGKNPTGVSFERLQIQIRREVEDSLIRQNIGNELTKFSRATIAYHIKEVCNNN